MENIEQATAAPGEVRDITGPCPTCGGTRTWTERIVVGRPTNGWAHEVETMPGLKHCRDCDERQIPDSLK